MTIGLVGSGPVIETASLTVDDLDMPVRRTDVDAVQSVDLAIVSGMAGSDGFETANELAKAGDTPWIAVELGGIGGTPVDGLDATISTFHPAGACFECLERRVRANDVDAVEDATADRSAARVAGSYAGLLASRIVAGQQRGGVVLEIPYAERTLLPVPGCRFADERDRDLDLSASTRTLEESIAHAEQSIDDRIGIISQVGEQESFPAPYYLATLAETTGFSDGTVPDRAAGVAAGWDEAFMKALGEGLERYSASVYRESFFRRAPVGEVEGPSPAEFVRPSDRPDPDPGETLSWVPGRNLETGDQTYLPADLVHFPPPESRFVPAITTGLGLGNGSVDAVISGLSEVIERDATMIGWYSTFEPLGLSVSDETFQVLSRRAESEGLSVVPTLQTQDVDVPVVTVAVSRSAWPSFAVGSAAGPDVESVAVSALSEALQNWMELRSMGPDRADDADGAIGRYAEDPEGAEELLDPDTVVSAESVGPADPPTGEAALDFLVDRLTREGLLAYAARITPRDVSQLGFEAVRVLSPESQPLFVDEPFFGDRARSVPEDLGFEPLLGRAMHPYP
ncbi:MAG: YcaO-like family protein [Halodesulfurarchaeum sp.]